MTTELERPRWDRKNEPFSEYQKRLESYVAQYRNQRSKPRVIERIETIREVVTERDDSDASARIEKLEQDARENADLLAYLMAPAHEDVDQFRFPAPDEKLSDWDVVGAEPEKLEPDDAAKLEADLHEGEAITAANKKRLFRTLNEELGRLKNQEALLGVSVPRRAEVESLLGILARVGDA